MHSTSLGLYDYTVFTLYQYQAQYVFIHDAMNEILSVGYTMVHPEKLHSLLANEEELKTQYKVHFLTKLSRINIISHS